MSGIIFASKYESFGVPLVEACIYKLPLIAPKLDYVESIVRGYYSYIDDDSESLNFALKKFKADLISNRVKIPNTKMITSPGNFIKNIIS